MPRTKKKSVQAKNMRDRNLIRGLRQDPVFREAENSRRAAELREQRQDPVVREAENASRSAELRARRQDDQFRTPERVRDASRRATARADPVRRRLDFDQSAESHRKRKRVENSNYEAILNKYYEKIKQGPVIICSCCGALLYIESTKNITKERLETIQRQKKLESDFVDNILQITQNVYRLCTTCYASALRGKVPRMCLGNGLKFPDQPVVLRGLNRLEERLIAPRIPFMSIMLSKYEQQWTLKGNVVNVENNLDTCVNALPRQFNEALVTQLQLKRRMSYRGYYIYDKISPFRILSALRHLLQTPLYRKHNIFLSEDWDHFNADEDAEVNFTVGNQDDAEESNVHDEEAEQTDDVDGVDCNEQFLLGAEETLLFAEPDIGSGITVIAPGEGNRPLYPHADPDAEYLCFPTIYCGQERVLKQGVKLTYTDIAKSELRNYDRRSAKPEKILYMFKKKYNEQLRDAYQICLRQKKKGVADRRLNAGDLRTPGGVKDIIVKDDGYAVFKHLRSSPAYWKEQVKRVVAMVRQLGRCHFFITLSAAETKWNELLVILTKILDHEDITEAEAEALSFEKKCKLISSDPATCMRHFDHKYKALLGDLFKKEHGVFEPHFAKDYYSRIEFQMRGSPHSHGLYWLNDAPLYDKDNPDSEQEVINFIDKYITCRRNEEGEMQKLIHYQIHKHSHTCKKGSRVMNNCRFGYPKPPLPTTCILHPLPNNYDDKERKRAKEHYKVIWEKLNTIKSSCRNNVDFNDFLESLNLTEEEYLLAIRTSIKRSTVFLKRQTSEIYVNSYNEKILRAWKANMDIQYVLDTYACAKYCVGYMLKAEGGVSKLLRIAADDAKKGNTSIQDKLKKFARILITGSEISAQEAVQFLLGLPNTYCNRSVVYINTAPANERIGMLKSQEELSQLPDDSEDVCQKGLLENYAQRAKELENECLAEYAAMYTFTKKKKSASEQSISNVQANPVPESDASDSDEGREERNLTSARFNLLDDTGHVRRRRVRRIIRFRHFNKSNPTDYWREQLMLFVPWRNEENELVNIDPEQTAEEKMQTILNNSKPYYSNRDVDDTVLGEYINEIEDNSFEREGNDENEIVENEMEVLEQDQHAAGFLEGTRATADPMERILAPRMIEDGLYMELMSQLNYKQFRIVMHILHSLKTDKPPFQIFMTGGAGVGKSRVVTAIVQSYMRYCNTLSSIPTDDICVLVGAPTGKAAFNVFGMTIHSILKIPPYQFAGTVCDLSEGVANSLRIKYRSVKLFIIDEISMISGRMFKILDKRLRQIFNPELLFGGKSVLVVGHLRQLPPIPGGPKHHIFKTPQDSGVSSLVARNPDWENFQFYELEEIMRQRGEHAFCTALNNMSEGCMTEEDICLLKKREIAANDLTPPKEAIWLFRTNKECREHNSKIHEQLDTDGAMSTAHDRVVGQGSSRSMNILLEDCKKLTPQQSDGMPYETFLKVGGVYFVTANIDVSDGLFNGALGVLMHIDYGETTARTRAPTRAWLEFEQPSIGMSMRSRNLALYAANNYPNHWVPIERITRSLSKAHTYPGLELLRTQIPVLAANGMTIAKAQGSSMQQVVVGMRRKLDREHLYVACSRATSLKGIYIDGEFTPPSHPGEDDVTKEIKILRKNPVQFSYRFFSDVSAEHKLYFHNVQSFPKYKIGIQSDVNIMSSSLIAFVEPHISSSHDVNLAGFYCVSRSNAVLSTADQTRSHGFLLYAREGLPEISCDTRIIRSRCRKHHCQISVFKYLDYTIIVCYKDPRFNRSDFLRELGLVLSSSDNVNVIVVGDFNINALPNPNQRSDLENFFQKYALRRLIDSTVSTTDLGTQIDHCYSNIPSIIASISETYYSYHKAICVSWN